MTVSNSGVLVTSSVQRTVNGADIRKCRDIESQQWGICTGMESANPWGLSLIPVLRQWFSQYQISQHLKVMVVDAVG